MNENYFVVVVLFANTSSCNTLSAAHVLTIAFHDAQLLALLQFGFVKLTSRPLAHQQPCSKT
jgi:hypothetical protein